MTPHPHARRAATLLLSVTLWAASTPLALRPAQADGGRLPPGG